MKYDIDEWMNVYRTGTIYNVDDKLTNTKYILDDMANDIKDKINEWIMHSISSDVELRRIIRGEVEDELMGDDEDITEENEDDLYLERCGM